MTGRIDMCRGPLAGNIVRFAIPVVLGDLLQLTFDAADMAVIGNWSVHGHSSLAAIGTTNSITNLLLTLVLGISGGVNVVAAQCYGAKDDRGISRTVHTGIALALFSGAVLLAVGVFAARPLLRWILVPEEILESAKLYLQLRFLGIPFLMIFTFGCVLLRAAGDTKRPLYYLVTAGVVNVVLNLVFVIVFKWAVAGVALATAAAKGLAAALVIRALVREGGPGRLMLSKIRFCIPTLKRILWLGIPSGLQSSCYWIANVIIQAAINTFGALTIAGNTAAGMLEAVLHTFTFAMYQSVLSFAGQNYGARKYDRVARSILVCLFFGMASSLVLGWGAYFCGWRLLGLFNSDPRVIGQGMIRLQVIFTTYWLVGALDVVGGGLRGVGRSVAPALVSLIGVCGFRIWWVLAVFPKFDSLTWLYATYPISWGIASLCNGAMLFMVCRRLLRGGEAPPCVGGGCA